MSCVVEPSCHALQDQGITEGGKKPLRASSPTIPPALPGPPLTMSPGATSTLVLDNSRDSDSTTELFGVLCNEHNQAEGRNFNY